VILKLCVFIQICSKWKNQVKTLYDLTALALSRFKLKPNGVLIRWVDTHTSCQNPQCTYVHSRCTYRSNSRVLKKWTLKQVYMGILLC